MTGPKDSESPSASASPSTKAVSILEIPQEISLPPSATSATPIRPSHLLRKSLSSKRLVTTTSPLSKTSQQAAQQASTEDLVLQEQREQALIDKVAVWLENERQRKQKKKEAAGTTEQTSDDESLNMLESILHQRSSMPSLQALPSTTPPRRTTLRRSNSRKKSLQPSSDTEYESGGDAMVPECAEWLKIPEEIGWENFKLEVLKLTHTLRCKGWRRVKLERYNEVGVERISGALTNAVYMVTPPSTLPPSLHTNRPLKPPAKLLLRIYGPQVSHLIDRATELHILRRLARQKIGPRLLGTFLNGRFEEFFVARTLTKSDIRDPSTSRHIAKRLKELHEGIDLLDTERIQGPIVWKNWAKWLPRCSSVMETVEQRHKVVGTTWPIFVSAVERYRDWLINYYGGETQLKEKLVFAHNDTQYGNILRLQAEGKSPLLLPMNEHRQLIVIDFEYASANTPGFEFANHFCEWMADYHDEDVPWKMRERRYPTDGEMRNFLTSYVEHSLRAPPPVAFDLDARTPAQDPLKGEKERKEEIKKEVEKLLQETKVWRAASSAMWAAWGIVQAKSEEIEEGEFDYLLYAQERALLFWGDMLDLGIYTKEELEKLEKGLSEKVKLVA
ncbi:choline kinase-like protein [Pyronema omphalodes]|nr:choline kinase-like protein [Pyronema omphalodes]